MEENDSRYQSIYNVNQRQSRTQLIVQTEDGLDFDRWDEELESDDLINKRRLYHEMKALMNESNSENCDVLWRLSKVCLILSTAAEMDKNDKKNRQLSEEALQWSTKAVNLEPNDVHCQKWYCASIGKMTKFVGIKQKIKYGQEFKEHIDIALRLDPNDYLLHFMFGRFCFELSSLSWLERQMASAVFGKVPISSYEEALSHFRSCDRLKPNWKNNYLWIAKTLFELNQKREAKKWIDNGLALSSDNMLDESAHKQLIKLKTKL